VTVSVINPDIKINTPYNNIGDKDFKIEWFSGTGKGGQHRNKHQNSCKLIHIPSGVSETRQGRKRQTNLREAKASLLAKLQHMRTCVKLGTLAVTRKDQVGSGMRGDKIRTYRFQDDSVHDHNTNSKARCVKIMKGYFDLLWD
jgi:peptide chain release factor 1